MPKKPISTPSQARSRDAKERILQAAYELYNLHGTKYVTAKMIAEKAHVAIGSLYVYFKDMRSISKAVFEYYIDQFFLNVNYESIMSTETDPITAIESVLIKLRAYVQASDNRFIEMQLLENEDPELQSLIDTFNNTMLELSKKALLSTGLPCVQPDLDVATAYVFLLIDSYLFRWPYYKKIVDTSQLTHDLAVTIATYLYGDAVKR